MPDVDADTAFAGSNRRMLKAALVGKARNTASRAERGERRRGSTAKDSAVGSVDT
jgi:hypothetical protein